MFLGENVNILVKCILVAVPLVFGILGGMLAARRGRNMAVWGILSAMFPIFIMIVYFEKPLRPVPGGFKKCPACGEWLKWSEASCRYCSAPQPTL